MTVADHYQRALETHGFESDASQRAAVARLDGLREDLLTKPAADAPLARVLRRLRPIAAKREPARGCYLWGGVGRGKTFVMDIFFESLPFRDKQRFHFHRFMYRIHQRLKALRGERDPLATVTDELAQQARVLCFDEFFVSDIGDAMILGRFLEGLFDRGISLVATSNIPPDDLYAGGLQRQNFLPAIEILKQHTDVVHLDAGADYRLRVLEQAEIWHAPLDSAAETNLAEYFEAIAPEHGSDSGAIEVLGRDIPYRRRADGVAWFDFAALCDGPRSQNDYIELARSFQTVLVSGVPRLDRDHENAARRFIALVDEFYDHRVKLIVSAEASVEDIYAGRRLRHEFRRTRSRLIEMQTHAYLGAQHVP